MSTICSDIQLVFFTFLVFGSLFSHLSLMTSLILFHGSFDSLSMKFRISKWSLAFLKMAQDLMVEIAVLFYHLDAWNLLKSGLWSDPSVPPTAITELFYFLRPIIWFISVLSVYVHVNKCHFDGSKSSNKYIIGGTKTDKLFSCFVSVSQNIVPTRLFSLRFQLWRSSLPTTDNTSCWHVLLISGWTWP